MAISETLTADGQSEPFTATGDFKIHIKGTFGGGTIIIEEKIGAAFEPIIGTEKTADSDDVFDAAGIGGIYRFDLSGSTTPSVTITVNGGVSREAIF